MSNMMSRLSMMYAMMGLMGGGYPSMGSPNQLLSEAELKRLREYRKKQRELALIGKGVIKWEIDGIEVFACNKKNAIRKVNNIKRDLMALLDENN